VAKGDAGAGAGVGVFVEDKLAVDEDVFDAVIVLEGVGVGGVVDDFGGVEEAEVGSEGFADQAAVAADRAACDTILYTCPVIVFRSF
jgi:hypothetical protein